MRVLVCSERFLPRFGADRVLVLLGQRLAALGHQVVWVGVRFDENLAGSAGDGSSGRAEIVPIPTDGVEYQRLDAHTAGWLRDHWKRIAPGERPGLAIVGGWPFYAAIPFLREQCPVVAVDFGAVPLDGYAGPARAIQELLRGLRSRYLEHASLIVAISGFIAESQSQPDSHGRVPVASLLLGADHMDGVPPPGSTVAAIEALHRAGKKAILNLGRWEPGCYKNSEAAFDLLRLIRARIPGCALVILAPPADVLVPPDLRDSVVPVGFPVDRELAELMTAVDLGVSVSLWEGFNLPLAEMQWLGRGALVFDCAAHPEVVADPWYLCRDLPEMSEKAVAALSEESRRSSLPPNALKRFRGRFRWDRFVRDFLDAVAPMTGVAALSGPTHIVLDVTNATRDPANTGVIRVTRRLSRALQAIASPVFAVWDEHASTYVLPTREECDQLGKFNGPAPPAELSPSPGPRVPLTSVLDGLPSTGRCCLFLTETVPAPRAEAARALASRHGIPLAAIFYDAIPVLYPELCPDAPIRDNHAAYMRALASCDLVLPISAFSGRCLEEYWERLDLPGGTVLPLPLPGEQSAQPRPRAVAAERGSAIQMLCVSTLEPRKNHATLIAACQMLDQRFPGLDWSLVLVGNRYAGAFEIADMVEDASRKDPRIKWLGVVPDGELAALYRDAAFTVYPSLVEGYGLPVLESVWAGTPCICRDQGVMAELAAGGGCVTVDVSDAGALCDAIGRLASDPARRRQLSEEAFRRPIATWDEYAARVAVALSSQCASAPGRVATAVGNGSTTSSTWTDILYPGCLIENWQQDDSERMAIAAVLMRRRPGCAVEIGTYRGGSLSLIRQHSSLVFSIDIEPVSPDLRARFPDVTFLRGPSAAILPILFRELDAAGIPVEFVLVDGHHAGADVASDIACILDYTPKTPMFVMLHDSFNPACRQGMRDAPWARSRHVQWVDLDFVPGRVVEDGGPFDGEMWGGLAMAYLTPESRVGDLPVHASADKMFHTLRRLQHHAP